MLIIHLIVNDGYFERQNSFFKTIVFSAILKVPLPAANLPAK